MVQESLQKSVDLLQEENEKLKAAIKEHLGSNALSSLQSQDIRIQPENSSSSSSSIAITTPSSSSTTTRGNINNNSSSSTQQQQQLTHPLKNTTNNLHYNLVKALQTAQQNFTITDPTLPDNPIIYASHGFLALTGYSLDQVLGRNCRFLQGPQSDSRAIEILRNGIKNGYDTTTVILNYRFDGTPFWNQLFIGPLKDSFGNVVNFLGVQCKVSELYAEAFLKTPNSYTATVTNISLYSSIMNNSSNSPNSIMTNSQAISEVDTTTTPSIISTPSSIVPTPDINESSINATNSLLISQSTLNDTPTSTMTPSISTTTPTTQKNYHSNGIDIMTSQLPLESSSFSKSSMKRSYHEAEINEI